MDNNQKRSAEDHQQSAFLERNPKETEENQIDLERDQPAQQSAKNAQQKTHPI